MRILLIDDEPDSIQPVLDEIKEKLNLTSEHCKCVTFDNANKDIESHNPQVIVLDLLKQKGAEAEPEGLKIHAYIWGAKFCPLIFYTGAPDLVSEHADGKHPFIKVVTKGANSEMKVLQCIEEFRPHITALDEAESEIRTTMNGALSEIAPLLFSTAQDNAERTEMLVRSARRRVAAKMDENLLTGVAASKGLKSWECYLFPPVVEHLLMGDVIRRSKGDTKAPEEYAVVLTPSCDLVKTATRNPKVDKVLVGRCAPVGRLLKDLNISSWKDNSDSRRNLQTVLTTGYAQSCMPLPALPSVFPEMVIDFRRLDLISIEAIGTSEKEYQRVVSIDNPWRELLAWAYMLSSARPGMPDRDCKTWASEISQLLVEPLN